jgi:hypothetical protein
MPPLAKNSRLVAVKASICSKKAGDKLRIFITN